MSFEFLLVALMLAAPVQPAPHVDARTVEEALAMIAVEEGVVEATRSYCGREVADSKRSFDYYAWQWRTNHQPELNAVAAFASTRYRDQHRAELGVWIESAVDAVKSSAARLGADVACADFLAGLQTGKRGIAARTPRSSAMLRAYLASHPLSERDAHQRSMTNGCIQQRFSKGADFDQAQGICDCMTAVTYRELNEVELADYRRVARAGQNLHSLAFMARLRPGLLACAAE
jgi:hypothetical protein